MEAICWGTLSKQTPWHAREDEESVTLCGKVVPFDVTEEHLANGVVEATVFDVGDTAYRFADWMALSNNVVPVEAAQPTEEAGG